MVMSRLCEEDKTSPVRPVSEASISRVRKTARDDPIKLGLSAESLDDFRYGSAFSSLLVV